MVANSVAELEGRMWDLNKEVNESREESAEFLKEIEALQADVDVGNVPTPGGTLPDDMARQLLADIENNTAVIAELKAVNEQLLRNYSALVGEEGRAGTSSEFSSFNF